MTTTRHASIRVRSIAFAVLLTACRQDGAAPPDSSGLSALRLRAPVSACSGDSLLPVAAAPAEGVWVSERYGSSTRVAAMVGPSSQHRDLARITRRVETLELRDGAPTLRLASDTASVTLEMLPPSGARGASPDPHAGTEPAAVYAITPLVLLASYEPCDATAGAPRLRYLRRDARGVVATDLMLHRESSETAGALP